MHNIIHNCLIAALLITDNRKHLVFGHEVLTTTQIVGKASSF